jgi:hypothetical protein
MGSRLPTRAVSYISCTSLGAPGKVASTISVSPAIWNAATASSREAPWCRHRDAPRGDAGDPSGDAGGAWRLREAANRLIQRQEHGAQKEGEPVSWDDARRIVFLTMFLMTEFATILEALPGPRVAVLEGGH